MSDQDFARVVWFFLDGVVEDVVVGFLVGREVMGEVFEVDFVGFGGNDFDGGFFFLEELEDGLVCFDEVECRLAGCDDEFDFDRGQEALKFLGVVCTGWLDGWGEGRRHDGDESGHGGGLEGGFVGVGIHRHGRRFYVGCW